MDCRELEITVESAKDLEMVRKKHKMKVYAAVTIGDSRTVKYTPPDKNNDINPAWNHTLKYTIGEKAVSQQGVMLVIKLYCKVSMGRDRYIGEISASLYDLLARSPQNSVDGTSSVRESHDVQRGSKSSHGFVTFSCRFGKTYVKKKPPFWKKALVSSGKLVAGAVVTNVIGVPVHYCCFKGSNEG